MGHTCRFESSHTQFRSEGNRLKVLITGGAGYIGSHIVDYLINQNHQVVVFDNLSTGHRAAVHPEAAFIQGDLLDKAALRACFASHQFDGVMHMAAQAQVGESMRKPFFYYEENLMGLLNVIEIAVEHDTRKIVFSSSSNIYGDPEIIPIRETEKAAPGSIYGETKLVGERILNWMATLHGITYCILRYFNAAGAHLLGSLGEDHAVETHLIPSVLQVALRQREHIMIFGTDYRTPDGTCVRDYIHVMDLARAHLMAISALQDGQNRIYNLGSGHGYSVQEVIDACQRITGCLIPVIKAERRPGDVETLVADCSKIRAELGWEPLYSELDTMVHTAWQWHQTHPRGYRSENPK